MATEHNANEVPGKNSDVNITRLNSDAKGDLTDDPRDEQQLQNEHFTIDLPDVNDIPGQENIVIPHFGEMADTTISSDDEEGAGLFPEDVTDEQDEIVEGNDADVTDTERDLLAKAAEDMPDEDDPSLRRAELDSTDNEGEPLNEGSLATDVSGGDLDTSGVDADDAMEAIGEEDEENNTFSMGDDDNDVESTP